MLSEWIDTGYNNNNKKKKRNKQSQILGAYTASQMTQEPPVNSCQNVCLV